MTSIEPVDARRRASGRSRPGDISLTVDSVTGDVMDALMTVKRVRAIGVDGPVITVEHAGARIDDVRRAVEAAGVRVLDIGIAMSPLAERFVDVESDPESFDVDYRIWRRDAD
jgi:hypothetical protein